MLPLQSVLTIYVCMHVCIYGESVSNFIVHYTEPFNLNTVFFSRDHEIECVCVSLCVIRYDLCKLKLSVHCAL